MQSGILAGVPAVARYLTYGLRPGGDVAAGLRALAGVVDGAGLVAGIGASTVAALGHTLPGLRCFPALTGPGLEVPSTPTALWVWARGDDAGELVHRTRRLEAALATAFVREQAIDAFRHAGGRDLTGYEDGTENPQDDDAARAAIVANAGPGLDGGSFVAVQQWVHQFDRFEAMTRTEQDLAIGRRITDNEEIDDAPASAHVKRTAQESFDPEAFVVRRSMPWSDAARAGLVFVAFGCTLDAFEVQLRRMVGLDDGIVDALFRFTRPVTGAYYWAPPMRAGRLDLSALGL